MPTTTGMKGGGFYDAHSKEQRAALDVFLPWLEQAVLALPKLADHRAAWSLIWLLKCQAGRALLFRWIPGVHRDLA